MLPQRPTKVPGRLLRAPSHPLLSGGSTGRKASSIPGVGDISCGHTGNIFKGHTGDSKSTSGTPGLILLGTPGLILLQGDDFPWTTHCCLRRLSWLGATLSQSGSLCSMMFLGSFTLHTNDTPSPWGNMSFPGGRLVSHSWASTSNITGEINHKTAHQGKIPLFSGHPVVQSLSQLIPSWAFSSPTLLSRRTTPLLWKGAPKSTFEPVGALSPCPSLATGLGYHIFLLSSCPNLLAPRMDRDWTTLATYTHYGWGLTGSHASTHQWEQGTP